MDGLKNLEKKLSERKNKNQRYLHSVNHVLADELTTKLRDKTHFGYYLKIAGTYDHSVIRKILGDVLEAKEAKTPGKLFTYLFNKHLKEHGLK